MNTSTTEPNTIPSGAAKPWRAALMIGIPAVMGGAAGYLVGATAMHSPRVQEHLGALSAWDLLALPVLVLFVLAVHELGHVLAGLSRGMRFLLLIVGPFKFSRSESGFRLDWVFNLGTFGGLAVLTPDPGHPLGPQMKRLVLGGPLASLLLALLALAIGLADYGRLNAYALAAGAVSMLIFCVTAFPLRAGGFMSDGMQWLELRRGGRAVEERQVLTTLMAQSLAGTRPRDLDAGLIAQALGFDSAEPLRCVVAHLFAYLAATDRCDREDAVTHATWLAAHIEGFPQGFRQGIALELALHAAANDDVESVRSWIERARGGVVDAARRALAEAELARLEGNLRQAQEALTKSRARLARGSDPGLNWLTRDQIEALSARL